MSSTIISAVTKGISGGFTGLGHTVDVWLFGIAGALLLFLVFGDHFLAMIHSLIQWLHIGSNTTAQIAKAVHIGQASQALIPYTPWTPGGYTLGMGGGSQGTALSIPWSPSWTIIVGGLWAVSLLLGILALYRGQRLGRPVMLWSPLLVGIVIFALPPALPGLLTAFWHIFTPHLTTALGSTIGLSAAQSATLITNPFWIWGAMWGISGAHGLAYSKVPLLISAPLTIAVAGHIAQAFTSMAKLAEGNISLLRETADWLYSVFDISVLLTVGMTVVLVLWTLLVLSAAIWLGISPAWIWIAALDPWSPELLGAVIGVALRAFAVQLGAWVWVAGVVVMDGGTNHGPFGLSVAFTGLTPWLTVLWTLLGIVLAWRYWMLPAWALLRHVQIDVAAWWTHTQEQMASVLGGTGHRVAQVGQQVREFSPQVGAYWIAGGETLEAAGEAWTDRARWRGMQAQWTEGEREGARRSGIGSGGASWQHPGAYAIGREGNSPASGTAASGAGARRSGTASGSAPSAASGGHAEAPSAPQHWMIPWQLRPNNRWEGQATSPDHAEQIRQALVKQWTDQGLTAAPPTLPKPSNQQLQAEARSQATKDMQAQPYFEAHPEAASDWIASRTDQLVQWKISQLQRTQLPTWRDTGALPDVTTEGNLIHITAQPGTRLAPAVLRTVQKPTQIDAPPLTRQRGGRTEVYRQGIWVAQSPQDTASPSPSRVHDPWADAPAPHLPEGGPSNES